jgi:hypothetical protein
MSYRHMSPHADYCTSPLVLNLTKIELDGSEGEGEHLLVQ